MAGTVKHIGWKSFSCIGPKTFPYFLGMLYFILPQQTNPSWHQPPVQDDTETISLFVPSLSLLHFSMMCTASTLRISAHAQNDTAKCKTIA